MKTRIAVLLLLSGSAATASTPAAWNQMNTRVNRACVAMSGLTRPVLLAKKISFSDVIGTEVRMIRGTDKSGRAKRLLCAYNRTTGRTEVQDADGWNGATATP
ncbi:MAG: hypothetical protein ABIO85_07865 [Sphingomicrobium sp.]